MVHPAAQSKDGADVSPSASSVCSVVSEEYCEEDSLDEFLLDPDTLARSSPNVSISRSQSRRNSEQDPLEMSWPTTGPLWKSQR